MKNSAFDSKKVLALFSLFAALAFMALAFQNFSFKSEPLGFSKSDHTEVYDALVKEVQNSDEEHKINSEAVLNKEYEKIRPARHLDSIKIETGEVYEGGPVSEDMNSNLQRE